MTYEEFTQIKRAVEYFYGGRCKRGKGACGIPV